MIQTRQFNIIKKENVKKAILIKQWFWQTEFINIDFGNIS